MSRWLYEQTLCGKFFAVLVGKSNVLKYDFSHYTALQEHSARVAKTNWEH